MNENPFNILNDEKAGEPVNENNELTGTDSAENRIKSFINENEIFIFVKGNPEMPQCGFSHNIMEIFNTIGKKYKTFDVLSDPSIRQGIKDFTNWPTIPQLFFKGEFVGGNDIVTSMFQSGELQELVNQS